MQSLTGVSGCLNWNSNHKGAKMNNQNYTAEQLRSRYKSGENLTWNEIYKLYEAVSSANFSAGWMGYPAGGPNLQLGDELETILKEGK